MKAHRTYKSFIIAVFSFVAVMAFLNSVHSQTIEIYQCDFIFSTGGDTVRNSDWGYLMLETPYYPNIVYFNLSIETPGLTTRWQVQNFPIFSQDPISSLQYTPCYFDIGDLGVDVTSLFYGFSITSDTIATEPIINRFISVQSFQFLAEYGESNGGLFNTNEIESGLNPAGPVVAGKVEDDAHASKIHLTNQNALKNGCAPNALSNSLKYLKSRNKSRLGEWMRDEHITKESIASAVGWDSVNGTPNGWWDKKRRYLDSLRIPISTRIFEWFQTAYIMNELKRGQDVEVRVEVDSFAHTAMLTDIWLCGGKYYFFFQFCGRNYNLGKLQNMKEFCILDSIENNLEGHPKWKKLRSPAYVVECPADTALPIEMNYFYSDTRDNIAQLHWSTVSESNNSGFEVQRLSADLNWTNLGFVKGAGNSAEPRSYSFQDRNLQSGIYNYRLRQIDFNGNFVFFELPEAVMIGVPDSYFLEQNYPNPFNPVTKIVYGIPAAGIVKLKVFDMNGREVKTLINEYRNAGYYTVKFDAAGLASGAYVYRFESGDFFSVKKMVYLK